MKPNITFLYYIQIPVTVYLKKYNVHVNYGYNKTRTLKSHV